MLELYKDYILAAETIEIGDYVIELGITAWWMPYVIETIKYILILLAIVYAIGIIFILMRIQSFRLKIKDAVEAAIQSGKLPKTKIQRKWDSIVADSEMANIEKKHAAVIDAEELLDSTLKAARISGENIESRLKLIPENQLNYKDDIVWVHKLKKKIESERAGEVEGEEVQRAIYIIQRALKELDVI